MSGAIPLLPNVPLWRGLRNFTFYLMTKHPVGTRYVSLMKNAWTHL